MKYECIQKVFIFSKPIDYAALLDPEDTHQLPYLSEIKDFSSGIMYRIWSDWGNCSLDWIGSSTVGDVNINQDGTISMMSPLEMFHFDSKFAANSYGVIFPNFPILIHL